MRHQGGDSHVQKNQVQKSSCPEGLMHNFIYKIYKRHLRTTIEHKAPTIQHPQKIELEILKGRSFAFKNLLVPLFPGTPPNSWRNQLPSSNPWRKLSILILILKIIPPPPYPKRKRGPSLVVSHLPGQIASFEQCKYVTWHPSSSSSFHSPLTATRSQP